MKYASIHSNVHKIKKRKKKSKAEKQSPHISTDYNNNQPFSPKSPEIINNKRKSSIYMSTKVLSSSVYERKFVASPSMAAKKSQPSFYNVPHTDQRTKENRNFIYPPSFINYDKSSRNDESFAQNYNQAYKSPSKQSRESEVLRSLRNVTKAQPGMSSYIIGILLQL